VEEAIEFDKKLNIQCWQNAIDKEKLDIGSSLEILDDECHTLIGWSKVTGHMIFDIKMDFTIKATWVFAGHRTPEVTRSTYAGNVSRQSVIIALAYAALNVLEFVLLILGMCVFSHQVFRRNTLYVALNLV
jgi:hypothetical protein